MRGKLNSAIHRTDSMKVGVNNVNNERNHSIHIIMSDFSSIIRTETIFGLN
jgi:hypothetical protein